MIKIRILVITFAAIFLFSCCTKNNPSDSQSQKNEKSKQVEKKSVNKILVVHSYKYDYEWVVGINRGIEIGLSGPDIEIQYFYMDTKNHTSQSWGEQKTVEVLDLIDTWKPKVVITVDDNAQKYLAEKLIGRKDLDVVFCGVNNELEVYGYPAENVTGVLERPHFTETMQFLHEILPEIKKVVVISDKGPTTEGTFKFMKTQDSKGIEVGQWYQIETLPQWKEKVLLSQNNADALVVYTYHTLKKHPQDQKSVNANDVINWTVEKSKIPVVGFLTFAIDNGTFCGVIESSLEQGALAAEITRKILDGQSPTQIPVTISKKAQKMINIDVANDLGLKISPEILQQTDILVGNQ